MAILGKIGKFQPAVEDWTHYVEHLMFFFTTNGHYSVWKRK